MNATSETNSLPSRPRNQLRPVTIQRNFIGTATGSALITCGNTRVICTASIEDKVPQWLRGSGKGWVTAEYGMLPGSCLVRKARSSRQGQVDGRTMEIQRLIGRSLRAVTDATVLGDITVWVDCDVIQADGGTRTASITGSFVALFDALAVWNATHPFARWPITDTVAAVSVGMVGGQPMLDLDYQADFSAEVDMNVVMTGHGEFVEVQGTAEAAPFSRDRLNELLSLAESGVKQLIRIQREVLGLGETEIAPGK